MKFSRNFGPDLDVVLGAIERGERFALARFNTGEWPMVLGQLAAGRGSGWKAEPERNRAYYDAMRAAWLCGHPAWHVGISCPCCNPVEHRWYSANLHIPVERVTFATLFMGSNWFKARKWLLANRRNYLLVAPRHGDFGVPANCFAPESWDWTKLLHNLCSTANGTPIVFACGPLGKILCHALLNAAKGPLVDIGSALDADIWKEATRLYMERPLRQRLKTKKAIKQNNRRKRLWKRTCKWRLAERPVHK